MIGEMEEVVVVAGVAVVEVVVGCDEVVTAGEDVEDVDVGTDAGVDVVRGGGVGSVGWSGESGESG